ncbi:hypothetical protein OGAPHI_006404 [Ogataea philodendri]|uniref:protein-tyrosine-phosphatase n=1 Tax=Ogataea philodendri TaxID=1378263 RepID=A0A9P8NYG6_9ASCO|nr:uncharacterized protein OGAPHI_006404 [Ogataea philodendri]KAH3661556.1 hypothetical protein OGAPHI_006404 [Ogataea philodendri]
MALFRVLGGIYLSSVEPFETNEDIYAQDGIRGILSVQKQPIPELYRTDPYIHHQIPIDDDDITNIIQHFHTANSFICSVIFNDSEITPLAAKSTKHQSHILIHCNAGCSRSVTILAGFLMKYYQMTLNVALYAIKRIKPDINPSDNFLNQLRFFASVDCEDNLSELIKISSYKQLVMELGHHNFAALVTDDYFYKDVRENQDAGSVLRCKRCRCLLANSSSFVPHEPPFEKNDKQAYFIKNAYKSHRIRDIQRGANECTHYFVEPLKWMQPELSLSELEGKFSCPRCKAKVGAYSWKGSRCSCGKWMVPAIHLQKAKVDEFKVKSVILDNARAIPN